jgi:hypothetical protein
MTLISENIRGAPLWRVLAHTHVHTHMYTNTHTHTESHTNKGRTCFWFCCACAHTHTHSHIKQRKNVFLVSLCARAHTHTHTHKHICLITCQQNLWNNSLFNSQIGDVPQPLNIDIYQVCYSLQTSTVICYTSTSHQTPRPSFSLNISLTCWLRFPTTCCLWSLHTIAMNPKYQYYRMYRTHPTA